MTEESMDSENRIPPNLQAEEWDPKKPALPPDGTMIIRPFKDLTTFWPDDQDREDWVVPLEQRHLRPLGDNIAKVFRVDCITDAEYISMSEEAKASLLSCVLTRSEIREVQTGFYEWNPICIVVKYCILVAVQVRVERATNKIEIPHCMLWAGAQKTYVPVTDPTADRIQNPGVLLPILERYGKMEGLL